MSKHSIVELISDPGGYKCGYCGNQSSAFSQGMWAHSLNVEDYQDLIDRGWRRSGKYCYKPTMNKTCCPQYAIRCHATEFKFTKSKKKVVKKMQQFILTGGQADIDSWIEHMKKKQSLGGGGDVIIDKMENSSDVVERNAEGIDESIQLKEETVPEIKTFESSAVISSDQSTSLPKTSSTLSFDSEMPLEEASQSTKKGVGPDPAKPPCKKAKIIRMERKMAKQLKGAIDFNTSSKTTQTMQKNLQDRLPHITPLDNVKHKLEVRLVPASTDNEDFLKSKEESLKLYQKYQCAIHKDSPEHCNEKQWKRFLVHSPLNVDKNGPGPGFGSFHNQYWMDDKLIAVGVIDILPKCVSSVYLYYDPDYGFLSIGVYSAISEIYLITLLRQQRPSLEYYYLGYYIHSCPKMRYKGAYNPSDLLCPETYNWVPVAKCIPTLDKQSYARLNELNGGSPSAVDHNGRMDDIGNVGCLFQHSALNYSAYKLMKYGFRDRNSLKLSAGSNTEADDEEIKQYVSFVGKDCARRMLLYRADDE